ncbi:DUF5107 domain-containing protein [Agromyces atrinae]|uniref:DUF5107 domain-containing protein n=1 Tax=Agromyces atrinae TaxID=592376 RepID=A0A4Q2M5T9_9MICO|nr:DUF5107 domain-containing protein [Agromyces atrinae]NYD67030.1 tetratricopeptide (TPR) repeat protein [Agromyces atrinae]RXZ85241.1 DUF5107 domain-containing protein [Agromyces atrinae]RXZ85349.1 DUF5107 domain-containing protein [Agromyces atrinae]
MSETSPSRIALPDAPADQREILHAGGVACWSEAIEIDTYEPAQPDRYPLFLDRRVYQGSSGKIYPLPFVDRIATTKAPRLWQAIHLENQWVRLTLLPEIGGRIHIGYDKTNGYDFFYRNNVIKPALVGLGGPWISGGVEFNWPQHHRPATFLPVEACIEREDDGAVTVWHSDIDPLQRMRGTHGVRLTGDSSLIEVRAKLFNRTDVEQTFLWWANVAARSDHDYQSFFPTDVNYVADHARRAITAFPNADRPYYGVDYPALAAERPGADRIDLYANIPVPSSYMITDTDDDFFGGYDHTAQAGFVHWADRSISPGKKQWTWGDGAIGRAWDRLLTDDDGPYVELMAGVYTDNQPDFSYLAPGETREFSQYWYPIQAIGAAHQATRDAAVSVDVDGGVTRIGVVSTRVVDVTITAELEGRRINAWSASLAPGVPFTVETEVPGARSRDDLTVRVECGDGLLVEWIGRHRDAGAEPWVATEPPLPAEIDSSDELYLTGLHLEQYRHPTRASGPYFAEIIARDAGDTRANEALARLALRRGEYTVALDHLDAALARETRRNLNPRSGGAHYVRALVLERLGRDAEAARDFGKAAWDGSFALPARLGLARIALRTGDAAAALDASEAALAIDARNTTAVAARVAALLDLGRADDAREALGTARSIDPLDPLLQALDGCLEPVDPRTLLLVAVELGRLGRTSDALEVATRAASASAGVFGNPAPVAHYVAAALLDAAGEHSAARDEREAARHTDVRLAFPAGLDEHDALRAALVADPDDAVARALLGCWLLDADRTPDALVELERALALGSTDPVAWRNTAIALVNTGGDTSRADELLARALELGGDERVVFERDQLAALRGIGSAERLALIEGAVPGVPERDDLAISMLGLLVDIGRHADALAILGERSFAPFEGGEGQVIAVFDRATIAVARDLVESGRAAEAVELLRDGIDAPLNLGEGRHPAAPLAARLVALGDAALVAGDTAAAHAAWRRAVEGGGSLAVGERPIDADRFAVGLAYARLGEEAAARAIRLELDDRAAELEARPDPVDYFATSLPELLLFSLHSDENRARRADVLRSLADELDRATTPVTEGAPA